MQGPEFQGEQVGGKAGGEAVWAHADYSGNRVLDTHLVQHKRGKVVEQVAALPFEVARLAAIAVRHMYVPERLLDVRPDVPFSPTPFQASLP